ncbi:SDR family oxidoreductase [Paenibacillus sp. S3N08]|uniref:SDR family oxidoreductase n=1 Tax=Paenibacillus agricola TaxID=2716264 RepID=A0ABX0J5K7_9BACL|nr:SDR family oxidoreductase [Paenibacillus agricola]
MNSTQRFAGKKVIITGAAGIFGTWIAQAFAKEGAILCLTDVREQELHALAADPLLKGCELLLHPTNLLDPESIKELVSLVEKEWSAPDILINNAGTYHRQTLLDMPLEEWDKVMALNVSAPFLLTQQFAKLMIKDEIKGSIINIGSGASLNVQVGGGHYSTTKAALSMLTRAYSLELAPYQIRVNTVGPGFAPGSVVSHLGDDYVENMVSSIPMGRTSGPNDAPQAILYLCSEQASFITGTTLFVDGGKTAGTFKSTK